MAQVVFFDFLLLGLHPTMKEFNHQRKMQPVVENCVFSVKFVYQTNHQLV